MRRAFVLALLFGCLQLIQPLGTPGFGSESLLTFGFLILGAYAAGELAATIGIPQLVGYLLAGVVFGPYALRTVPAAAVADLAPVSSLAIALIAFLAGAELRWEEIRARGGIIFRILASELGLALVVITGPARGVPCIRAVFGRNVGARGDRIQPRVRQHCGGALAGRRHGAPHGDGRARPGRAHIARPRAAQRRRDRAAAHRDTHTWRRCSFLRTGPPSPR